MENNNTVVDPKVIETNNTRVGFVIEIIHS